ncbi:hypothetical protein BAS10_18175 [Elizabethkingia meningoseptica]|uniref:hypothetical protein n=1 Tax=Elizabethkingia meningoseptica TaxID=238 RepID=UPI0009997CBE|nr:hypothetical protein [Elizabethkingia meningoseptica]OPC02114.1 hypothetical protein BAS10_18175 [Elizabethkingia meningoseptica]
MGSILSALSSIFNPIEGTARTIVDMYRMSGNRDKRHNLQDILYHRLIAAGKLKNPNIPVIARLAKDEFFDTIEDDIALFIFVVLMAESDKFNLEFSKNPEKYFFRIETEVIKRLHTYVPDRDSNYIKARLLAISFGKYDSTSGHRPIY